MVSESETSPEPAESLEIQIAKAAARVLTQNDWHTLNPRETALVTLLEQGGYIIPRNPPNGYVGMVNPEK